MKLINIKIKLGINEPVSCIIISMQVLQQFWVKLLQYRAQNTFCTCCTLHSELISRYFLSKTSLTKSVTCNKYQSISNHQQKKISNLNLDKLYFQGKQLIVVLNKIDLIPSPLVAAWKNYFTTTYPGVHIVYFTSFPAYNMVGVRENKRGLKIRYLKGLYKQNSMRGVSYLLADGFSLSQKTINLI